MQELKTVIAVIAVALVFIGYIPYFKDIIRGKTIPHVYSWFIWTLETFIIYALQVSGGAGPGAWTNLAVIIIGISIFLLGLRNGKKDITKTDTVFFILSFVALFLWLVVKQPVLSVILVSSIDILGFVPTVRKSWNKPHSETLSMWELGALRHFLSILALNQYNLLTWFNPALWVIANALFSGILIIRRRQVVQKVGAEGGI